jgi:hypothetical protein
VKPIEDLPNNFLVLNDKGGESRLKLEDPTPCFFSYGLSGKIRLSNFAQQNFYQPFLFLVSVDLRTSSIV